MMELGEELRFTLEPRQALPVFGERRRQDLDRHLALEARVGGAVDLAHAALADLGEDLVGAEAGAGREGAHRVGILGEQAGDYNVGRPRRLAVAGVRRRLCR